LLTSGIVLLAAGLSLALQVGDRAPDFALPAMTADKVSLADYLGQKHLVIFFYIAAFGRA
jgi:peroxiredoxin